MTNTTYNETTRVETPKGIGTTIGESKGWVEVQLDDGNTAKFRAKMLSIVAEDENPDGHARIRPDWAKLQRVRAASGKRSFDNGDAVAQLLRGQTLEDVLEIVAEQLSELHGEPTTPEALLKRYEHLNPGHIRMCVGNKLRAAYKRAAEVEEADEAQAA